MTTFDTETTIVREIEINAPAARIFAALTDPSELIQWWGDDATYRCTNMERDLHVGGTWRTTGLDADGSTFAVGGTYRAIEPPHLLEYTWLHDWGPEGAPETLVRFELEEHEGKTSMRVTHSGFTDTASKADHDKGWTRVLGWLRAYAER